MSTHTSVKRLFAILNFLRDKKQATFEEIRNHLLSDSYRDEYFDISLRTFQRDIKLIEDIFKIEIKSSRNEGYSLDLEQGDSEVISRFLSYMDMIRIASSSELLKSFVINEQNHPRDKKYVESCMKAIESHSKILIKHKGYFSKESKKYILKPIGLKEFYQRWYLIALKEDNQLRTFGLDRVSDFTILDKKFKSDAEKNEDIIDKIKNIHGVSFEEDTPLSKVILACTEEQSKYYKSVPLHPSQKIKITDNELVYLEYYIRWNTEFVYRLLAEGDRITVVEPQELRDYIVRIITQMNKKYQGDTI